MLKSALGSAGLVIANDIVSSHLVAETSKAAAPTQAQSFDTEVLNRYVEQNSFLTEKANTNAPPAFDSIRARLPVPVWPNRPDVIDCYWYTWRTAFGNLHGVTAANGFVSPYIDPAFNGHIFMWDSVFMTMFGRYASAAFHFQGTLDNFYRKQHKNGFICREIRESDGTDVFDEYDPSSTGPNIMPWGEWEYFLNFGDESRLKKVFFPLLAYYQWFREFRSWPDGSYFSTGWGCGMDNQPRVPAGFDPAWSSAHMSWIDTTLQQIFAGKTLIGMAQHLNEMEEVRGIQQEVDQLTEYVNTHMWDDKTAFYYDRYQDGSLSHLMSIAGFWALLAGVVPEKSMSRFIAHLENTNEFNRLHRVPSIATSDPGYVPEGGYWRGGVWSPTTYMVLRGLSRCHKDALAHEIALNDLNNVVEVFSQTGMLWENYSPDKVQGNDTKNMVGWTGLTPTAELLEYVFGLRPDVPHNTLVWDVRLTDEFGVEQYPFAGKGVISLHCEKRKSATDVPAISIESRFPFELVLLWTGGKKHVKIPHGKTTY